ncbi:phosphopantetheine-binding protein [Streptomyces alfalfae]
MCIRDRKEGARGSGEPVAVLPAAPAPGVAAPVPGPLPEAPAGEESGARESGGPLQELVADAWRDVLGVTTVRPDDDFQEVGGDSILATQIISRLKSGFPFELDLGELFQARTLADMVEMLEAELIERIDELPEETVATLLA